MFRAATGFKDAEEARTEAAKRRVLEVLEGLRRHSSPFDATLFASVEEGLVSAFPGLEDDVRLAVQQLTEKHKKKTAPKSNRGRKSKVDDEHLFILAFLQLEAEAQEAQQVFRVHIIVDRGFRNFRTTLTSNRPRMPLDLSGCA